MTKTREDDNLENFISATTTEKNEPTITLRSKDGDVFTLPAKVARISQLVRDTIQCSDEDDGNEEDLFSNNDNADNENEQEELSSPQTRNRQNHEVQLPNVRSSTLNNVVSFLNHYAIEPLQPLETPLAGHKLDHIIPQVWYREFARSLEDNDTEIFELVTAANYMDIKPLLDLTCLVVSLSLMGKDAEEIRRKLNIPKMTEEEEARAREEHAWIFEDT
mmetsp:Transcript_20309/g.25103  ORF Transcript_20309/g.25103 Transcript_20309/m.25103 type:complete len:219 (-) Transcript_20309:228-884(-)|eukprot:CAMPEP_0172496992 /NCGR_PEP_ID=MMETSP1066-20121228/94735_1 /TAXON_ID=671091 /ORGANISM="Coscinodiscus wailesii, Strain CCMP2513" /LENGTH=218 /DNA_ID=CAMNT_0013269561 /DNA_START=88 /DNA_END=744 /DNA_ORIENTATION=+